ncbi:MAG: FtsX-like permease family protein [Treponema sp.]|nr:FtsX-like permease family protein [Treponema sp.]
MLYLKLGLRNILKNFRKNLLTIVMISFGMTALFIYGGSNTQMFKQFRDMVIHEQYGHFQLHTKGYSESGRKKPFDYLIKNASKIEEQLLAEDFISFVAPRLHFSGIASSDTKSTVIQGFGGDAAAEGRMEYRKVNAGKCIGNTDTFCAVIGERALRRLSASVGSTITVLSNMKGGGISAVDLTITGTKKSSGEGDIRNQMFVLADLAAVQELIDASDSVDTLIVHLKDGQSFKKAERQIAAFCNANNLEYETWNNLALFYERSRQVFSMNEKMLTIIILIISVFIIINTLYMSYMSRVREIGTIRAIGTTKKQVLKLFISESIILALAGCVLGITAASLIGDVINGLGGIYHPSSVFNEEAYYTLIKPEFTKILLYCLLFTAVSIAASGVISFRAMKLSIADSLRWN